MIKILVLLLALTSVTACHRQQNQDFKETRFLLGTVVEFTVYADNETSALAAIHQAAEQMHRVEHAFTTHGDVANTVQHFNRAVAGEKVALSPQVDALLQQALAYNRLSDGAFDPTLGA